MDTGKESRFLSQTVRILAPHSAVLWLWTSPISSLCLFPYLQYDKNHLLSGRWQGWDEECKAGRTRETSNKGHYLVQSYHFWLRKLRFREMSQPLPGTLMPGVGNWTMATRDSCCHQAIFIEHFWSAVCHTPPYPLMTALGGEHSHFLHAGDVEIGTESSHNSLRRIRKDWSWDTNLARLKRHFLHIWQLVLLPWPYLSTRSDQALQGNIRAKGFQGAPGGWSPTIPHVRQGSCPVLGPLFSLTGPGSASLCNSTGLNPEGQRWLLLQEALLVASGPSPGPLNTH